MDDDIPEQGFLNFEETLTCARVSMRRLCISAGRAAAQTRKLTAALDQVNAALGDLNDACGELDLG